MLLIKNFEAHSNYLISYLTRLTPEHSMFKILEAQR